MQKIYPDTIENKIGFDIVRQMVSSQCLSSLGKAECERMQFSPIYKEVERQLEETHEMVRILEGPDEFPLGGIHDMTQQLKTIKVAGTHIPEGDLSRLRSSLAAMAAIASFFAHCKEENPYPRLDEIAQGIASFPGVLADIDRVIDKFGQVKDTASPELARLRSSLASMQGSINTAMRRVIANAVKAGLLEPDTAPSLRDGRPVIPVAPMNKRRIPGIVHDESASGKTYYIEPAEVVEASNRLRELQLDERREVLRILVELADKLRPHVPEMLEAYGILGVFDFIHAKARFAGEVGGMMPHLHQDMQLELYHAVHPVLKQTLEKQGREVVPLDIRLVPDERLLVISGPNAGGKSVTLKTVAISQYMAQCGLLPPAYENSHISVVDGIFIDIGDDQSIENELSTYSSHLRNMKYFLSQSTDRTLVLIDEFGSGTEPQIGGAIAQAVLAEFAKIGLWGVITTHYQNLKHFADDTPGLVNGSMLYDRQLMQPLFKLQIGAPGSSFAIEIARKTGLPASIIAEAERIVGSDYINLDKYLLDIARDKRYWEDKRQQIRLKEKKIDTLIDKYETDAEQLRLKRREIIDEARTQAQQILEGSNAAVEKAIQEIRTSQAERERTLAARKELAETKRSLTEETSDDNHPMLKKRKGAKKPKAEKPEKEDRPIGVGDRVLLDGSGTVGEVLEVSGKNATVAFGMIKTTVKTDRLKRTMKQVQSGAQKAASFVSASTANAMRERQLQFKPEIDVRGMRVDEAVQAITYFIDDATQFSAQRVRILHGTGTGALRQYLRDYLATVPSVASFRDEDVRFGGAGITVVELK
ncbi:MAG: Smr/MutS family protein [Bacteroidales bacterium]|nr:Smr/MutS family protein [Bacteroidales bacterium]